MSDSTPIVIELFPTWWWRWHFVVVWQDGLMMRTTKATFGYLRTRNRAYNIAQEARRG